MRILIDTNILIHLEDSSRTLEASFSEVVRLCQENNHNILIHPASYDDLQRDQNQVRREIIYTRLLKYSILEQPPQLTPEDLSRLAIAQSGDNDRVDNQILFAVYKNAVNFLITEDRQIHTKAKQLGITDRVHYIQQAAEFLRRLYSRKIIQLPHIDNLSLHQLNLQESFFDSLREDYPGFNNWFEKVSREGRKAWVYRDDQNGIGALCIYKEETDAIITSSNIALPGKVLKLCTFKVGEKVRGRKIGELFLKSAFRYATENKLSHIYVTMNPERQAFLLDLCLDFGFYYAGQINNDHVYTKYHPINPPEPIDDSLEYHKRYYPHFKCDSHIQKFIVPIRPHYHELLFPDAQKQGSFLIHTSGNAIKQAYLCHSRLKSMKPGDILLFYRSRDWKAITSIGIVETSDISTDPDKVIQLVSKRTVYTYRNIVTMAKHKLGANTILFRLTYHLKKPIEYKWLKRREIINGYIQTITKISDESFQKIINEGGITHCFYANQTAVRGKNIIG